MSAEQNKSIVYRWVEEAWNQGNFTSASRLYPTNYQLHDVSTPMPIDSRDALVGFIQSFRRGIPNLHMTIDQVVCEGDMVVWRFHVEGTQTNELLGVPGTGRPIHTTGVVMSRFENGQWIEDYSFWDVLTMLRQMGVIPDQAPQKQ